MGLQEDEEQNPYAYWDYEEAAWWDALVLLKKARVLSEEGETVALFFNFLNGD